MPPINSLNWQTLLYVLPWNRIKAACFPSTIGVDNHCFQPKKLPRNWRSLCFLSSCFQSQLKTTALRATLNMEDAKFLISFGHCQRYLSEKLKTTWKTLSFHSAIKIDNHGFQSYQKLERQYASCKPVNFQSCLTKIPQSDYASIHLLWLTTAAFKAT